LTLPVTGGGACGRHVSGRRGRGRAHVRGHVEPREEPRALIHHPSARACVGDRLVRAAAHARKLLVDELGRDRAREARGRARSGLVKGRDRGVLLAEAPAEGKSGAGAWA
jgi:hypothetical protein